jgi:hypothetical protein
MRIKYIFVLIVLLYTINQPIFATTIIATPPVVAVPPSSVELLQEKEPKKWFFDWGANLASPDKGYPVYLYASILLPIMFFDLSLVYKSNNWDYSINIGHNSNQYKLVLFRELYLNLKTTYTFINNNNFKMHTGGG